MPQQQVRGCEIAAVLREEEPVASRTLVIRQHVPLRPYRRFVE